MLSLGFLRHLLTELPVEEVVWIATAVAAHHRPFTTDDPTPRRAIFARYELLTLQEFGDGFGPLYPRVIADLTDWCNLVAHERDCPRRIEAACQRRLSAWLDAGRGSGRLSGLQTTRPLTLRLSHLRLY